VHRKLLAGRYESLGQFRKKYFKEVLVKNTRDAHDPTEESFRLFSSQIEKGMGYKQGNIPFASKYRMRYSEITFTGKG
jgi:hypothetical protein